MMKIQRLFLVAVLVAPVMATGCNSSPTPAQTSPQNHDHDDHDGHNHGEDDNHDHDGDGKPDHDAAEH